jgi:SPP1 gp7 family putative phage head morphogenesis protein
MITDTSVRERRVARRKARERFSRAKIAGKAYERSLRAVAKQVGIIVRGMAPGPRVYPSALTAALQQYAQMLRPWAKSVAERMVAEVAQRDYKAWMSAAREMGSLLTYEITKAPIGERTRQLVEEQVELITSLPLDAARRVQSLAIESITATGARPAAIAEEILRTGQVTESHALLIARTESAKASSALTMARAEFVGAEGYIWRTAGDSDVRPLHRRLEGKFISFDDPPVAGENGERAHAGMIYNCRCWMEPVLPDIL